MEDNELTTFPSVMDEADPSLIDGHSIMFSKEVPFELRIQEVGSEPQEVGTLESIHVKLLVMGTPDNYRHIKIELTSENDLFFHYTHAVDPDGFQFM